MSPHFVTMLYYSVCYNKIKTSTGGIQMNLPDTATTDNTPLRVVAVDD